MNPNLLFKLKISFSLFFLSISIGLFSQNIKNQFDDSWGKHGISLLKEDAQALEINFSLSGFTLLEENIKNENNYKVVMDGVLLPNNEGAPDIPVLSQYIAVPQGAEVRASIKKVRTEKLIDVEIAPAPRIPFDTEIGPLSYEKDPEIFTKNALYPEQIIQVVRTHENTWCGCGAHCRQPISI